MKKIKSFFTGFLNNNGVLKIISFVAAFVFWFIVVGTESPDIEREYTGIPVTTAFDASAQDGGLILANELNVTVNAVLKGSRSEIYSFNRDKLTARVDYSGVTVAGTYVLPIVVEYDNPSLKLERTSISEVNVKIDNKVSKSIAINVSTTGNVADDCILESVKPYPSSLLVTGPESIVSSLSSASVFFSIDGESSSISKNLPYTLIDNTGSTVSSSLLSFDVPQIMVTANIFKTKDVTLTYGIYNSYGGNDDTFINKTITPSVITISGNEDIISRINTIELGKLDVATVPDSGFTEEINIALPNGVKAVDGGLTATVTVSYDDIVSHTFSVPIVAEDIIGAGDRRVTTNVKNIAVTLRGRQEDIERITAAEIEPVIDVSNQTVTGRVTVPVRFDIPDDLGVGVKGEYSISVTIK